MSAKPETTFTASVHRFLPPPSELYRMKNSNQYNSGIADVWYSGKRDLWVEYKYIVVPKRDTTVIDLIGRANPTISALQQDWLKGRWKEGRNVWVIVGCKEGGVVFQKLDWERAFTAREFRSWVQSRAAVARLITEFVHELPTTVHHGESDARHLPHHINRAAHRVPRQATKLT